MTRECCDQNCRQGRACPARTPGMQKWQTYPRTMKEAFGPYTNDTLYDDDEESPVPLFGTDDLVAAAIIVIFVAVLVLGAFS